MKPILLLLLISSNLLASPMLNCHSDSGFNFEINTKSKTISVYNDQEIIDHFLPDIFGTLYVQDTIVGFRAEENLDIGFYLEVSFEPGRDEGDGFIEYNPTNFESEVYCILR